MKKQKKIDPAKATPQAQRSLRVGRGRAEAPAAAPPPAPAPAEEAKPNEDEDEDEDENGQAMAECAQAFRTASASSSSAVEALDACADELEAGTDSITSLTAAEAACNEAIEELEEAIAKSMALRGAEAEQEEEAAAAPPPAAPQGSARAAGAPVATVAGHIQVARLAKLGSFAMSALKLSDPDAAMAALGPRLELAAFAMNELGAKDARKARALLGARLDAAAKVNALAGELATTKRSADEVKREQLWNDAISGGAFRAGQVWEQVDGPSGADGKPTRAKAYSAFAARINAQYADVDDLAARLAAEPKLQGNVDPEPNADAAAAFDAARGFHMSEATAELARKRGIDPKKLAADTEALFAKQGAR